MAYARCACVCVCVCGGTSMCVYLCRVCMCVCACVVCACVCVCVCVIQSWHPYNNSLLSLYHRRTSCMIVCGKRSTSCPCSRWTCPFMVCFHVSLQPCLHSYCSGCYSLWMVKSNLCPMVSEGRREERWDQ